MQRKLCYELVGIFCSSFIWPLNNNYDVHKAYRNKCLTKIIIIDVFWLVGFRMKPIFPWLHMNFPIYRCSREGGPRRDRVWQNWPTAKEAFGLRFPWFNTYIGVIAFLCGLAWVTIVPLAVIVYWCQDTDIIRKIRVNVGLIWFRTKPCTGAAHACHSAWIGIVRRTRVYVEQFVPNCERCICWRPDPLSVWTEVCNHNCWDIQMRCLRIYILENQLHVKPHTNQYVVYWIYLAGNNLIFCHANESVESVPLGLVVFW